MNKMLEELTFNELVQQAQGTIILAIPTGGFNEAVGNACYLAVQWRVQQELKRKQERNT